MTVPKPYKHHLPELKKNAMTMLIVLAKHLDRPPRVDELAAHLGISRATYHRYLGKDDDFLKALRAVEERTMGPPPPTGEVTDSRVEAEDDPDDE